MDRSSWLLWAVDDEAAKISKAVRDPKFLESSMILIGVLLLAAVLFSLLQKWRKRQFENRNPTDQLTSFRALYESGELSKEEYDQIKQRMANRVQSKPGASRSAQPPKPEPPPPIDLMDYD